MCKSNAQRNARPDESIEARAASGGFWEGRTSGVLGRARLRPPVQGGSLASQERAQLRPPLKGGSWWAREGVAAVTAPGLTKPKLKLNQNKAKAKRNLNETSTKPFWFSFSLVYFSSALGGNPARPAGGAPSCPRGAACTGGEGGGESASGNRQKGRKVVSALIALLPLSFALI